MAEPAFSQALRRYLSRTRNTTSGQPVTLLELSEALHTQTGDAAWRERLEAWGNGAPFPSSEPDKLVTLATFLGQRGGLSTPEDVDQFFAAAGYAPPSASVRQAILQRPEPPATKTAEAAPNQAAQSAIQPPEPDVPAREAKLDYKGVQIVVAQIARGWRLAIDALVMSDAAGAVGTGGRFYMALKADLPPGWQDDLNGLLANHHRKRRVGRSPIDVPLSQDMANLVLPFAPPGKARIILTNFSESQDEDSRDNDPIIRNLVDLATQKGVQNLAMPVIGTRGGHYDTVNVAEQTLALIFANETFGSLQSITLLTVEPEVVDMAQRLFNRYLNSQAQVLSNDYPGGIDLLGIAPEIQALADTLMLREVKPPLAVGIAGTWGSGKSFVMHLLHNRISHVRTRLVTKGWADDSGAGKIPPFVGHAYLIRFNAWTYAKSSLWASLMQTIFFELNRQMSLEQAFDRKQAGKEAPDLAAAARQGGGHYEQLYIEDYQVDSETLAAIPADEQAGNVLWRTMRARKREQYRKLGEAEQKVAEAKVGRDTVLLQRQAAVDHDIEYQVRQAAVQALITKVTAIAGNILEKSAPGLKENLPISGADAEQVLGSLRSVRAAASNLWVTIQKNKHVALGLGVFTILAGLGAIWVNNTQNLSGMQRVLAALAPLAPPALLIARQVGNWSKRVDEIVQEYQSTVESERAKQQNMRDQRLAQKRAEDEMAVSEIMAKPNLNEQDNIAELTGLANDPTRPNLVAQEWLLQLLEAEAEVQRREVGPTAEYVTLLDFVRARLDAASYESQLGLMHQVKADIDELTASLVESRWDSAEDKQEKQTLFPRGEPRVFLFIDDLDRCPPLRVVEVLEAVQLLLNTRLFVAVLGLDTRYVTRALEKEYKDILQRDGDPSGLDYIEKIVQIPYRVRPIETRSLRNFLSAQMEILAAPSTDGQLGGVTAPLDLKPAAKPAQPPPDRRLPAASAVELPPEVIKFAQEDYDDLVRCCDVINLTPRSVKRLVNVLKLIKIFWFRSQNRDRPRSVKQSVMALLALSAAYPEVMAEAFLTLDTKLSDPQTAAATRVMETLEGLQLPKRFESMLGWQLEGYRADVKVLGEGDFGNIALANLGLSSLNLVRSFSFVADPSYGANQAEQETTLQPPAAAARKAAAKRPRKKAPKAP